jgi:hypothetical protein
MSIDHDQQTGRVRTDEAGLSRLIDAAVGGSADDPAAVSALADHRVAAVVSAVSMPLLQLRCLVADRDRLVDHRAWVVPGVAAFALVVDDSRFDLLGLAPDHVPAALAKLTGIGPRMTERRESKMVERTVVDDAFHADSLLRASAFASADADRAWQLGVAVDGEEMAMTVLDGLNGLWLVERATLVPTSPTELFGRFTRIFR